MKQRTATVFSLAVLLSAAPAHAVNIHNSNISVFNSNGGTLTSSSLGAIIASSHVDFHPGAMSTYEGNVVSAHAFDHALGLMAVNQNTGINGIAQQAITVKANNVTLNAQQ